MMGVSYVYIKIIISTTIIVINSSKIMYQEITLEKTPRITA
jgi:hypothetical protein